MFAGACASHFIPPNTRLGTIEYLPNMGYIKEDHAEVAAVRSMLRMMAARGAAAFVVNIVSGTKRYENDARGGGQGAAASSFVQVDDGGYCKTLKGVLRAAECVDGRHWRRARRGT